MSSNAKVVIAVASGYLLGRSKKMKLAITVGSMLAGQRIATDPRGLMKQGQQLVQGNEELSQIQDQIQSKLLEAAKAAALATLSSRMELFSDSIRDRTDSLRGLAGELEEAADEAEDQESEDQESEDQESDDEQSEDEQSEDEPAEKPTAKKSTAKKTASKRSSSSGTAKKSTAKKAPAKKSTAKKAPAKKSTAKKAPAKKSTAKKSTAKKSTAKKSSSSGGSRSKS
jgi:outer membrane biosynthesis protein TonB